MLKKLKKKSIATLRNKADKLSQELFVLTNPRCEGCGQTTQCGHHYFPKSTSSNLRYNFKNWIAVCQSCHFKHHNGNPELHAMVLMKRGVQWHAELELERHKYVKTDRYFYENIIEKLKFSLK